MLFLSLFLLNFLIYIFNFIENLIEIISIFITNIAADILDRDYKRKEASDGQDEQVSDEERLT